MSSPAPPYTLQTVAQVEEGAPIALYDAVGWSAYTQHPSTAESEDLVATKERHPTRPDNPSKTNRC